MSTNILFNPHQSAYCKHNSTETALLYIHDYLISAIGLKNIMSLSSWPLCCIWYRQNIVSYLCNTPIQRRRSHSGKTRCRYNRELRIRYNNFYSKKNIYVLKDINFINSYIEKSHFAKKYVQMYIWSNSQQHRLRSNPRPVASHNQSQTQLIRPVLDLQRVH